jgi:hypothetical protein
LSSIFLTELKVQKIGARRWRLLEDLLFYSEKYQGYVMVPAGFETNFASIPRLFWIRFPPVDVYDPAATVHDAAYENQLQTIMGARIYTIKDVADDLFYEGLIACGVNERDAKIMYRAVRIGGDPIGPNPE